MANTVNPFRVEQLGKGSYVLAGDAGESRKTLGRIISDWKDGPLVVFDSAGELYRRYSRDHDVCVSGLYEGSRVGDPFRTILMHPAIGASPESAAEFLCEALSPEGKSRGGDNEDFWRNHGREVNKKYWLYQIVELKEALQEWDRMNITLWMARNDRGLHALQYDVLNQPKAQPERNTPLRAESDASMGRPALFKFLKGAGEYEKARAVGLSPIYLEPLGRYVGKNQGSTAVSMVASAASHMAGIRSFFEAIAALGDDFLRSAAFEIGGYVHAPKGRAAFIPSLKRGALTDSSLAALMLVAFSAAADALGTPVTFIIPELDRWRAGPVLEFLTRRFGSRSLRCIAGVRSESRYKELMDTKRNVVDLVADSIDAEGVLWHRSKKKDLRELFDERTPADRPYGLDDLTEGMAALDLEDGCLRYVTIEDGVEGDRELRERRNSDASEPPWLLR